MSDFSDEDDFLTFAIHFVLSDDGNVRSILSDFVLLLNIYFHLSYLLKLFFFFNFRKIAIFNSPLILLIKNH